MSSLVGDTEKSIAAVFSLARKLAPAIVFMDEIDSILATRNNYDQSYLARAQGEFLSALDGLTTSDHHQVMLLGATNLPENIDPAILRRMPRKFEVPLPNEEGRLKILKLNLEEQELDEKVMDLLPQLMKKTEGFSGSDLREVCRAAAMQPIMEATARMSKEAVSRSANSTNDVEYCVMVGNEESDEGLRLNVRPIEIKDFLLAIEKTRPSDRRPDSSSMHAE